MKNENKKVVTLESTDSTTYLVIPERPEAEGSADLVNERSVGDGCIGCVVE